MEEKFDGRVALVTASASGIGLATAKAFLERGASVVMSDINEKEGVRVAGELVDQGYPVLYVTADMRSESDVQSLIQSATKRYGKIDFAANVVGNALGDANGPLLHTQSRAGWADTIDLCMGSTFLCMKHEIAQMMDQGGGAIVNVASLAGLVYVPESGIAYSSAKAAIIQMTRFAAVSYAEAGIRVNCIAPGVTPTPAYYRRGQEAGDAQISNMVSRQAIKRPISPTEQAQAILWLCSDGASMVTGHTLPVDGGWAAM